jgi:ribokinase
MARHASVKVILDPSPSRHIPRDLLQHIAMVKPNAREATLLTGIEVTDLSSARVAASSLLESGVEVVAIEAGREGNLFVSRREEIFLRRHEIAAVDPTGAGDAMVGALAVAMAEERSLRASAELACAAAALATRALGAQTAMPRPDEVEQLLAGQLP